MSEPNYSVANADLRRLVEKMKSDGMPRGLAITHEFVRDEHARPLAEILPLTQRIKGLYDHGDRPAAGNALCLAMIGLRNLLQQYALIGILEYKKMQELAVLVGAIPDPAEKWKYYRLPDKSFACWHCGAEVLCVDQTQSDRIPGMPLAGFGRVRHKVVPFCPNCETRPSERGTFVEEPEFDVC